MSRQQSQKRRSPSVPRKEDNARKSPAPVPPSQPVRGAFGDEERNTVSDEDEGMPTSTDEASGKDARYRRERRE